MEFNNSLFKGGIILGTSKIALCKRKLLGGEAAVARSHQWQLGSSNKRMSLTDGKEGETQQIQPKSGANSQMERGRESSNYNLGAKFNQNPDFPTDGNYC